MKENFVHLHVHSDMSVLDGCSTIEDYVRTAAERGNPAVALTDHGTMRGCYALTELCDKYSIKPIYGVELYVCKDMNRKGLTEEEKQKAKENCRTKAEEKEAIKEFERTLEIRKNRHLTVWALDNTGLKNLYKLTSKGWIDGFYYRPRIDLDTLIEHNEGVAIGTGCVGSIVYDPWINKQPRQADSALGKLSEVFGDRLYIEIQPHDDDQQRKANEFAKLVREISSSHKLVATQDAHYLTPEMADTHDILLAIREHKSVGESDRLRFPGVSYWFKTEEEMYSSFCESHSYLPQEFIDEAMATTMEIAERCTAKIEIDSLKCLLPPVEIPEGHKSEYGYLCHLVTEGLKQRRVTKNIKTYVARAKHELRVLKKSGFVNYYLILHDLYRWVKEQKIVRGPGRGSAAGSLVAYLIGITDVDPIEHRLMFERFISPGRNNMPDVDCDFDDLRRHEVVDYLRKKYGDDRVAQISTMTKMNGRQALKDVARAYEVPYTRANTVCSQVPEGQGGAIKMALGQSEHFQEFQRDWVDVVDHSMLLEGVTKTVSMHAAGIVTSPVPLVEMLPLETNRSGSAPTIVTAYDMRGVENVGLLKIDVLGLKTLSILDDARRMAVDCTGESFELIDLPIEDRKTLDAFTKRDFVGVFQFDSASARQVSEGMTYTCFDDIAVINAINRPGAVDFADEYKRRRNQNDELEVVFHPRVSEITADALGLMIYQEHVIKIATDIAGFTGSEADKLRKKIGKSEGIEAIEQERAKFVRGCCETTPDMTRETAEDLFDAITKFGRYGFNRSHSVCYSLLGYWTQYFKQHHPLEFYCALLRRETDHEKLHRIVQDAKRHGIETMLPDINVSSGEFSVDYEHNALRGSLREIKGVGKAAIDAIIKSRNKDGLFTDMVDFLKRVRGRAVNLKVVEALAIGGAFDELLPNIRWFVIGFRDLWEKYVTKENWDGLDDRILRSHNHMQWTSEERLIDAVEVNPLAMPPHPLISWESWIEDNVKFPLESIGSDLMAEERVVYIAGRITKIEDRAVGDSIEHEDMPDEQTQKSIGWDNPWAWVTLDSINEERVKVKIDWTIYDDAAGILDKGIGSLVLVCGTTNPEWRSINAHFVAELTSMADKLKRKAYNELSVAEQMFVRHPANAYKFKTKDHRRLAKKNLSDAIKTSNGSMRAIAVVSHLRTRIDRRGEEMAFFGLAGVDSYIDVVCFSSSWHEYKSHMKNGTFALFKLSKLDDGGLHLDSKRGGIHLFD